MSGNTRRRPYDFAAKTAQSMAAKADCVVSFRAFSTDMAVPYETPSVWERIVVAPITAASAIASSTRDSDGYDGEGDTFSSSPAKRTRESSALFKGGKTRDGVSLTEPVDVGADCDEWLAIEAKGRAVAGYPGGRRRERQVGWGGDGVGRSRGRG